jgi:hypothetical protein
LLNLSKFLGKIGNYFYCLTLIKNQKMRTKVVFIVLLFAFAHFCFSTTAQTLYTPTFNLMTNPDPNHNGLNSTWGIDGSVFAVGDNGTVLKCDNSVWGQISNSSNQHLYGVWGSSATNVWFVGNYGTVLHYTGTSTLAAVSIGTTERLTGIFGFSANDIYICGHYGILYHYNGSVWSQISTPSINFSFGGMFGIASNDLYLVGCDLFSPYIQRMYHYDGSSLSQIVSGNYGYGWFSVWTPDNNLFYIGGRELFRFNKTTNNVDQILDGNNNFYGFNANSIIVAKNNDAYDSLVVYNGSVWDRYNFNYHIKSIYSPNNDIHNVFLVGWNGIIFHLDLVSGLPPETNVFSEFKVYPNPSNGGNIHIDLNFKENTRATIVVLNSAGQQVQTIFSGESLGKESFEISSGLPAGIYFVNINTAGGIYSRKIVILK